MKNPFYLKRKTTKQTPNKSTIIKSIRIVLLKLMPNMRFSPNTIISLQELTLNKFSRENLKYFCVCLTVKETSHSFYLFSHTFTTLLFQACFLLSHATLYELSNFSQEAAPSLCCDTLLLAILSLNHDTLFSRNCLSQLWLHINFSHVALYIRDLSPHTFISNQKSCFS